MIQVCGVRLSFGGVGYLYSQQSTTHHPLTHTTHTSHQSNTRTAPPAQVGHQGEARPAGRLNKGRKHEQVARGRARAPRAREAEEEGSVERDEEELDPQPAPGAEAGVGLVAGPPAEGAAEDVGGPGGGGEAAWEVVVDWWGGREVLAIDLWFMHAVCMGQSIGWLAGLAR